jgi:hypothetical protein
VTFELSKACAVSLNPYDSARAALINLSVNNIELQLILVKANPEIRRLRRVARITCAPLDIKEAVGRFSAYRGKDGVCDRARARIAAIRPRAKIVPVRKYRVAEARRRKAGVCEIGAAARKLKDAV